jgi:F-type H+-transporting ATPase subunit b|nr:CF0 subunit I of ATP synthase [Interfilum sp. SAG 36.88]
MLQWIWACFEWLSPGSSWGINGDPFETNLLNLGVVIGVLAYFGSGLLNSLLTERKQAIEASLKDADNRFAEATTRLEQAKAGLEAAKKQAKNIRIQGMLAIDKHESAMFWAGQGAFKEIEAWREASLRLGLSRAKSRVQLRISRAALKQAQEAIRSQLHKEAQEAVIVKSAEKIGNLRS